MQAPRAHPRTFALPWILALALALVGSGCGASGPLDAGAEPAAGTARTTLATPRAAAERAAVAERLGADVRWLADGEREGRRAGTAGERAAAEWIAARLAALGLEPAGDPGYLQGFPVPLQPEDGGGSRIELSGVGGAPVLTDVSPLFCSEGGPATGPLWFHGYGIDDPELGILEHGPREPGGAAAPPAGRVALVVRGAPPAWEDGAAPREDRERELARHRALFAKVMAAKHRGAAAVLVAQHPDERGAELLPFDPGAGARAGVPALFVSVATAEALVPDYVARVRAIDAAPTASVPLAARGGEVTVHADVRRGQGTAYNVLGLLAGGDEGTVVIGAHYDHLGLGGVGSLAPGSLGQVHHGADDNASGVAVTLEVARRLAAGPRPPGDVLFALWSGEELGLLGSQHFLEHPTVRLEELLFKLNLDMVGRAGGGRLIVLGAGSSPAFAAWLGEAGPAVGLELDVNLSAQGVGGSDHQSFVRRQIPALHLFSGLHGDYHRPSDTAERFEAEGAARVVDLCLDLVRRAHAARSLPFAPDAAPDPAGEPRRMRGFAVRFGSQPDYAFPGPGMRIGGTSPGSPAERAGFLPGDVLLALGAVQIDGVQDLMYALGVHKPGDVVQARFLRDGREQTTSVTLVSAQAE